MTTLTAITVIAISGCVAVLIGVFAILLHLFGAPRPKWTGDLLPASTAGSSAARAEPDSRLVVTLDCGHQVIVHQGSAAGKNCKCPKCAPESRRMTPVAPPALRSTAYRRRTEVLPPIRPAGMMDGKWTKEESTEMKRRYSEPSDSPARLRMRYLNRLLRLNAKVRQIHPTKRADWAHFCCKCGADISHAPRYTRTCQNCKGAK